MQTNHQKINHIINLLSTRLDNLETKHEVYLSMLPEKRPHESILEIQNADTAEKRIKYDEISDPTGLQSKDPIIINLDIDQCILPSEDSGDLLWIAQKYFEQITLHLPEAEYDLYDFLTCIILKLLNPYLMKVVQDILNKFRNVHVNLCTAKGKLVDEADVKYQITHTTMYVDQDHGRFVQGQKCKLVHIPGSYNREKIKQVFKNESYTNCIRALAVADAVQV